MLKIYLARHGQDQDNSNGILNGQRDTPLTEIGLNQAKELAKKIKDSDIKFKKVYSSPLKRAYQTAKIISDTLKMDSPQRLDLLKERSFGKYDGMLLKDIPQTFGKDLLVTEKINYILSPQGGETFPVLLKRGQDALKKLTKENSQGNILVVAHGDIGKMIYAAYYKLDWKEVLKLFHFGNSDLILLSPDSKPEDVHVFQMKQYN